MLSKVLKEIGLSESEIKVYLALLDLGETKSGDILKKAKMNSGRIYEILHSLIEKGFVTFIIKSGTKYFSPSNPEKIKDYIDQKKKEIEEQEKDFNQILPNILKKINETKKETKVEIYYGLNGLKTAFKKELEYGEKGGFVNIIGVSSRENYPLAPYDFFTYEQQPKRQNRVKIIRKVLDEEARKTRSKMHEKNAKIRYMQFSSPVTYSITKGLVLINIYGGSQEVMIISIESAELSQSFIQQFEVLWKMAKK